MVVVVRAGVMAPGRVVETPTDAFEDCGVYTVSVEAAGHRPQRGSGAEVIRRAVIEIERQLTLQGTKTHAIRKVSLDELDRVPRFTKDS